MQFDKGYVSAYFVTDNDRMEAVMKDPYILITDQKISSVQDIMPVLEAVQRAGRGLLIIAEDIDGEALPTWSSTRSVAPSTSAPLRPRATAIAASASSRTSPSSPVARLPWTSWA